MFAAHEHSQLGYPARVTRASCYKGGDVEHCALDHTRGNRMNAIAAPAPTASVKAAWICLAIAWVCFLVPIPGIGVFVGWPLNLVAFILAIVAMSKRGAMAGLFQLLASLIVSPIVYFVGLAILAGSIGAAAEAGKVSQDAAATDAAASTAVEAPAVSVGARELFAAYDANEVAADQQFKGKRLQVSGTVDGINSDLGDDPVVMLAAGDFQSVHVQGLPKDVAAGLSKGQHITVVCTGNGEVIGSPMLDDCSVL
jgi:tRNA_anti-like